MSYQVKYPRRRFQRYALRTIGRLLIPLFAKIQVEDKENFPKHGPLIVVGNHTAAMEVVMMTLYTPWLVEFMGSVDIPHEKIIAAIVNIYGFIPVFRGNVTPSSMQAGLGVLKQGGVLGVFPEGGIWEPAIRRAQAGVAWLSYHAQAPILPIGFGSMQGALAKMFTFKRPTLKMCVGKRMPAVKVPEGVTRKVRFQEAANQIMDAVWELIPAEDRLQEQAILDERFDLKAEAYDQQGKRISIPKAREIKNGAALSKFIHRRTLILNFRVNLGIDIEPLLTLADQPDLNDILSCSQAILEYLTDQNPYYFTYRYGMKEGLAMGQGIKQLFDLVVWAIDKQVSLKLTPTRRFVIAATNQEVTLDRPEKFEKW